MGYYTSYELDMEATSSSKYTQQALEVLVDTYLRDNDILSNLLEPSKWYKHDEDMIELSKRFPDVLFTLRGLGDDYGDLWRTYYLNGKMQYAGAKITFPEFDPALLEKLVICTHELEEYT